MNRFVPLGVLALFVGFFAWVSQRGSASMMLVPLSSPAPALMLTDMQGKSHSLVDYRGRVVLVHFWATWCGPCRHEIPALSAMARQYESRGLALLAIHVGESPTSLPLFLRQVPIAGSVLQDRESQIFNRWGGQVIPTTYVVGRDGEIHWVSRGEADWTDVENLRLIEGLL